jgi:hypothetical protein
LTKESQIEKEALNSPNSKCKRSKVAFPVSHGVMDSRRARSLSTVTIPLWSLNQPFFPQDSAESLRKEIKEEMTRTKTAKGFKATHYNIVAYGQKT